MVELTANQPMRKSRLHTSVEVSQPVGEPVIQSISETTTQFSSSPS